MSNHKLTIIYDKCQGYARCVKRAPDVFKLDEKGKSSFVADDLVPSDQARRAARACPYRALTVTDPETGEQVYPVLQKTTN